KVKEEKEEEVAEGEEVGWRFPDLRESPVHGSGSEGSPPTSHINKDPGDQSSTKAIESQGPDRSHEEDSTQTPGMNAHIVEEEEEEEDVVDNQPSPSPSHSPPASGEPDQENQTEPTKTFSHCCPDCEKEFSRPWSQRCPVCGQDLPTEQALRKHLRTHMGEDLGHTGGQEDGEEEVGGESPVHGSGSEGSPPTSHINKNPGEQSRSKPRSLGPDHRGAFSQTLGMNIKVVEEEELEDLSQTVGVTVKEEEEEEEVSGFIQSPVEEVDWEAVDLSKWREDVDLRACPNHCSDSEERPPHQENHTAKDRHHTENTSLTPALTLFEGPDQSH
ncbi:unnamed protein product, partial [Coregonus sp. 'balchen']